LRAPLLGLWLALSLVAPARAEVYLAPEEFVTQAFRGHPPAPSRLWLDAAQRGAVARILERDLGQLRVRYWHANDRTVWILDEIGKEQPITTGLVVDGHALADVRILEYRESRGWEVKYPAFTDQFRGLTLGPDGKLSGPIDGISGATLSVRAVTKLARLALLLDGYAQQQAPQ
jgi:hypothetical protein